MMALINPFERIIVGYIRDDDDDDDEEQDIHTYGESYHKLRRVYNN